MKYLLLTAALLGCLFVGDAEARRPARIVKKSKAVAKKVVKMPKLPGVCANGTCR